MAKEEIILDVKLNTEQSIKNAEDLGNNVEKMAKGLTDLAGGVAMVFGASDKNAQQLQQNFAKIIGITTAVKGGIEGITSGIKVYQSVLPKATAAMKVFGAALSSLPIFALIAGIAALAAGIAALISWFSSSDDAMEDSKKRVEALEKANKDLDKSYERLSASIEYNKAVSEDNAATQIALLKEQGAKQSEIAAAETKLLETREKNNNKAINANKEQVAAKKEIIEGLKEELRTQEILSQGAFYDDYEEYNKTLKILNETVKEYNGLIKKGTELKVEGGKINNQERVQDAKNAKAEKADREEANKKWQDYLNLRLTIARQIEDLQTNLIQDEQTREETALQIKYRRQIEDLADTKFVGEERKNLLKAIEENLQNDLAKIKKKYADKQAAEDLKIATEARLAAAKSKNDALAELEQANEEAYQNSRTAEEREITAVQDKYFRLLELAKQNNEDTKALEDEQQRQITEIQKKYSEERQQAALDEANKKIDAVGFFVSASSSLTESLFEISNNLGKQDEAAQLARAKRQFNIKKVVDVAEAGINTAKGITAAIAQFGPPPSPLGIAGIITASAIGATQIGAILSKKFEGGGTTPSTGSLGSGGSSASASASNTPTDTALYGTAGAFNAVGGGAGSKDNQNPTQGTIKAVVIGQNVTNQQQQDAAYKQAFSLSVGSGG